MANSRNINRSVHRPISITVESIEHMPVERVLPSQTDLTVNLKMNREMAAKFIQFLQKDLDSKHMDIDWFIVTIKGVTP